MRIQQPVLPAEVIETSAVLTRARLTASALPGAPATLPEDLETAYAIQHNSIGQWPDRVAGWKVGGVPPAFIERFDQTRLAGPIFSQSIVYAEAGRTAQMPVFAGGFAAIEPEFVLQIGETRDQDRLFIGAEIASSPIPAINDYGPVAVISDFGNNNGLLVGAEVHNWREEREPVTIATSIDEKEIAAREITVVGDNVEAARAFLFDLAERLGFTLPEGTYISSGAITGVHEAPIGSRSKLDFGRFGELHLELVQAKPFA